MKKVTLTIAEWQRLAAVTPQERERAAKKVARWVHWAIYHHGFDLDSGPFSYAAMGGNPVEVITEECLEALFCGEWHWKTTRELSSQLIQIAKSKMAHIIEDFYDHDQPQITLLSEQSFREEVEMNLATQWKFEANMREMGYEIARDVVKKHADLLAYLDAMFQDDNYYGIASILGVDVKKVMQLEKKLLDLLAKV